MVAISEPDYLEATAKIDHRHAGLRAVAAHVGDAPTAREAAVRLHDYVRDEIRYGFCAPMYDQSASQVLKAGIGYGLTKSTLFVALLRALGIPARQHFVDISAEILHGIMASRTPFTDHCYVEVLLDEGWVRVDSFIVDLPLAEAARARLRREGRMIGYGVHIDGVSVWDGRRDTFCQFVDNGSVEGFSTTDHGLFRDIDEFHEKADSWNRVGLLARLFMPAFVSAANSRCEALRHAPGRIATAAE